eukprot:1144660-Pelagomonas_calceolata.AAC.6
MQQVGIKPKGTLWYTAAFTPKHAEPKGSGVNRCTSSSTRKSAGAMREQPTWSYKASTRIVPISGHYIIPRGLYIRAPAGWLLT